MGKRAGCRGWPRSSSASRPGMTPYSGYRDSAADWARVHCKHVRQDSRGRGSASRMYISRVRLENIRGFSDRRNVDLTLTRPDGSHAGWTVLAGRNGSGKSSLLRAIALTVAGPWLVSNLIPDFRSWITVDRQRSSASVQLVTSPEDFQSAEGPRAEILDVEIFWEVDQGRETSRPGSQPTMA